MLTSRILISTQHRPTQGRSCYFSWAVREQPQSIAWRKSLAAVCWEFLVKTRMYPNLCSLPLHSFFSNLLLPLTFIPSHLPFFSPSFVVFHPLISCFLTRQKLIFSYWSYPYPLGLPRAWKILTRYRCCCTQGKNDSTNQCFVCLWWTQPRRTLVMRVKQDSVNT